MYIGLLKLNLFLGSDVRKLVVEGAIKLRLTIIDEYTSTRKQNCKGKYENKSGEKVVREREHELSCQINDFTWYKERLVFHL